MSVVAFSHFRKILYIVLKLRINTIYRFPIWQKSIEAFKFFSNFKFSAKIKEHNTSEKKLYDTSELRRTLFIFLHLLI